MRFDAELFADIHPAEPVPAIWLVVGVALVVAAAALVIVAVVLPIVVRWVRRRAHGRGPSALEVMRERHLDEMDQVIQRWRDQRLSSADALHACSGEARGFIGVVLDVDVDFMTLGEIERMTPTEPRLQETAELVRTSYPMSFADASDESVLDLLQGFRRVVHEWR